MKKQIAFRHRLEFNIIIEVMGYNRRIVAMDRCNAALYNINLDLSFVVVIQEHKL